MLLEQPHFGVVSAAQLVAMTGDAMLGGVAKVVSMNCTWDEHLLAKLTYQSGKSIFTDRSRAVLLLWIFFC